MNWVTLLSGPIIGAIIGYCTNYIAVKMLFRPKNPVMIGGKQLPFTPGIIPRRKAALGAAVGKAVESELFNGEDVKQILASPSSKKVVADGISSMISQVINSDKSIETLLLETVGERTYEDTMYQLQETIADKVVTNVVDMNLGPLLCEKAGAVIAENIANPLIAMFITPDLLNQFAEPVNQEIARYIQGEGYNKIEEILEKELNEATAKTPVELVPSFRLIMYHLQDKIGDLYLDFIDKHAANIAAQFNIRQVVEAKMAAMSNEDLENLVLSVMKKELNMIVNLGALIGFVLGLLNTLF